MKLVAVKLAQSPYIGGVTIDPVIDLRRPEHSKQYTLELKKTGDLEIQLTNRPGVTCVVSKAAIINTVMVEEAPAEK